MSTAQDFAPLNPGGTAEKHPHMPVPADEIRKGIPVEKEHTNSKTKARAIAVDHVVEIPDYYKRLKKLETQAEDEGVKRAALHPAHQAILDDATRQANDELFRSKLLGEASAGVASVATNIPALGLLLPGIGEFRNDARDALEAKAQRQANALGQLRQQLEGGKLSFDLSQTSTQMGAAPRGDELHLPMGTNPNMGDPKASSEYENGFDYAQALGHQALNQVTEGDIARWSSSAVAWREGFADACEKFGLSRVGNLVLSPPKTASTGANRSLAYTLFNLEAPMHIVPMTDALKTAMGPGMAALLGAGLGATAGGVTGGLAGSDQDNRLMDYGFDSALHQFSPSADASQPPTFDHRMSDPAVDAVRGIGADLREYLPGADSMIPNSNAGNAALGGATVGAGLGGAVGYGANRMHQPPKFAAFTDIDSDLEGSAIEALQAKVAALGTTLGTLGGIAGGALLGNYATPAMHWAVSPGEHAALGNLAQSEVAGPAAGAVDPSATPEARAAAMEQLHAGISRVTNPDFLQGAQAGAGSAGDAAWQGMSDLGTVAGAGVGGIAGYQAGRGMDQAFGLERKERPMVISPMHRQF